MNAMETSIDSLETLKEWISNQDNAKNFMNIKIPEICKTEKCILGVDEAGRGPVLGKYGFSFHSIFLNHR